MLVDACEFVGPLSGNGVAREWADEFFQSFDQKLNLAWGDSDVALR
jgi:hypothetical protein